MTKEKIMSNLQKRQDSQTRIYSLEKEFIMTIDKFSKENPNLTTNEVVAVMLKMITFYNDQELRENIRE